MTKQELEIAEALGVVTSATWALNRFTQVNDQSAINTAVNKAYIILVEARQNLEELITIDKED